MYFKWKNDSVSQRIIDIIKLETRLYNKINMFIIKEMNSSKMSYAGINE